MVDEFGAEIASGSRLNMCPGDGLQIMGPVGTDLVFDPVLDLSLFSVSWDREQGIHSLLVRDWASIERAFGNTPLHIETTATSILPAEDGPADKHELVIVFDRPSCEYETKVT